MDSNENRIITIISKVLDIDSKKISVKSDMKNTKEWDSLNHMNILLELSKEFNIPIDSNTVTELTSFKKILKHLKK